MQHSPAKLLREYRCQSCAARLVERIGKDGPYVACPRCDATSGFVHEREIERQKSDASEVLEGLPLELAEQLGHKSLPKRKKGEIFSLSSNSIEI